MAVTYNGTINSLPDAQLPTGYTRPTVTQATGTLYVQFVTLTVAKGTVENATESTTMTNIFTNASIGLNKQINDILDNDFISTNTVTAHGELYHLSINTSDNSVGESTWLTDTAESYVCKCKIYVNVA